MTDIKIGFFVLLFFLFVSMSLRSQIMFFRMAMRYHRAKQFKFTFTPARLDGPLSNRKPHINHVISCFFTETLHIPAFLLESLRLQPKQYKSCKTFL